MITKKELETHFEKDFETILEDKDIVFIGNNIDEAWEDYKKFENGFIDTTPVDELKSKFYEWIEKCEAKDLFEYSLDTFERHFMLKEDEKIYYLNNIEV